MCFRASASTLPAHSFVAQHCSTCQQDFLGKSALRTSVRGAHASVQVDCASVRAEQASWQMSKRVDEWLEHSRAPLAHVSLDKIQGVCLDLFGWLANTTFICEPKNNVSKKKKKICSSGK